jgi:hypothetical protein
VAAAGWHSCVEIRDLGQQCGGAGGSRGHRAHHCRRPAPWGCAYPDQTRARLPRCRGPVHPSSGGGSSPRTPAKALTAASPAAGRGAPSQAAPASGAAARGSHRPRRPPRPPRRRRRQEAWGRCWRDGRCPAKARPRAARAARRRRGQATRRAAAGVLPAVEARACEWRGLRHYRWLHR